MSPCKIRTVQTTGVIVCVNNITALALVVNNSLILTREREREKENPLLGVEVDAEKSRGADEAVPILRPVGKGPAETPPAQSSHAHLASRRPDVPTLVTLLLLGCQIPW